MGDTNPKDNGIALGVLVNNSGKVLIIKRVRSEHGTDNSVLTWAFPGGKLDGMESFEQAVVREILAETGYKTKIVKLISERFHPQFNVPIKYFACEFAEFTTKPIQEIHEVETIKWVDPSELKDFFTTDLDLKVAKYLNIA